MDGDEAKIPIAVQWILKDRRDREISGARVSIIRGLTDDRCTPPPPPPPSARLVILFGKSISRKPTSQPGDLDSYLERA